MNFGTIIGLPFNIINYEPIDTTNPEFYTTLINPTATQIDFATLLLSPTIHEDDSSHTIEFSINNPIFIVIVITIKRRNNCHNNQEA